MSELHAAAWPSLAIGLAVVAVIAAVSGLRGRWPASLEWLRRAALVLLVAQGGIGLALAVRGAAPGELLHWIYGVVIVAVLLMPGSLPPKTTAGRRSWILAGGSTIGVILVWRLAASG